MKEECWLEEIHKGEDTVRDVQNELKYLSIGLKLTFPHISDKIDHLVSDLDESLKNISSGTWRNLNESIEHSDKFISNCINTILYKQNG